MRTTSTAWPDEHATAKAPGAATTSKAPPADRRCRSDDVLGADGTTPLARRQRPKPLGARVDGPEGAVGLNRDGTEAVGIGHTQRGLQGELFTSLDGEDAHLGRQLAGNDDGVLAYGQAHRSRRCRRARHLRKLVVQEDDRRQTAQEADEPRSTGPQERLNRPGVGAAPGPSSVGGAFAQLTVDGSETDHARLVEAALRVSR